jgi:hypothetical protein
MEHKAKAETELTHIQIGQLQHQQELAVFTQAAVVVLVKAAALAAQEVQAAAVQVEQILSELRELLIQALAAAAALSLALEQG